MVAGVLLAAPWPGRVPELIGCGRAREHFLDIRAVNEFSRNPSYCCVLHKRHYAEQVFNHGPPKLGPFYSKFR